MDNERSHWHSDDELASALERSLEVDAQHTGSIPTVGAASESSIGDLFAALVVEDSTTSVVHSETLDTQLPPTITNDGPLEEHSPVPLAGSGSPEQIFESLDDFKPRTNFIPVQQAAPTIPETTASVVQPPSSQVTMPVQWTPQRPSFDEVVFGSSPTTP